MDTSTIEQQIAQFEKHVSRLKRAGLRLVPPPELTEDEWAQVKKFEEDFTAGQHFPLIDSSEILTPIKKSCLL